MAVFHRSTLSCHIAASPIAMQMLECKCAKPNKNVHTLMQRTRFEAANSHSSNRQFGWIESIESRM